MTELTPQEEAEIRANLEAADATIGALCSGDERWRMSIPARQDDPDLVISRSLRDISRLLDTITVLREENEKLRETLGDFAAWIEFSLEGEIKYQQTGSGPTRNGYSYVEIPEWKMRQKLEAARAGEAGKE